MLFTEEKGMSMFEKESESWSSTPTYDFPFCLDKKKKYADSSEMHKVQLSENVKTENL